MKLALAVCVVLVEMILADDLVPDLIVQSVKMMHQNRSKRSLNPIMEKAVKMVFDKIDQNHDGHITVDELIQFMKKERGFDIDETIQFVNKTIGLTIDQTTRGGDKMVFGNPTYDLNENGTIELNEYAGFVMGMGK